MRGRGVNRVSKGVAWRLGVLALAVTTTGFAHSRMDTASHLEESELWIPDPDHASLSTFGFDALLSDYYWLMTIQLVGGERGRTEQHAPLIGRLIDIVTTLDPWVDHPYRFATFWLSESPETVREANRLLERGIAFHPLEWRNFYYLGFNYFYNLGDNARAAEYLERAADLEGSPHYLGALVARLRSDLGGLDIAAGFLLELVRTTEDEYARASYLKALDELQTERAARFLDEARMKYWEINSRDIERVEDLATGPRPVLVGLPPAHPQLEGWDWVLDEKGRIVSSFYGSRYELHVDPVVRERMTQRRSASLGGVADGV